MRIAGNGVGMSYLLDGVVDGRPAASPVVTLSHALAASSAMWSAQTADLTPSYGVLRYDTRGHGETEIPPTRTRWSSWLTTCMRCFAAWGSSAYRP